MPEIRLEHITKRWGKFYGVDDLNLVIENNAFVTLLGPSGCGKTTTLRMIAGLETPTSGRITIGDTVVFDSELGINIPANKRKVGFLFQNYALWPNMTVYQNISFGLSNIKEEMPKISFEAKNAARLAQILKNPQDVVKALEECRDKNGKLDEKKAIIKLIDTYTISQYTAKKLFGYHLEQGKDVSAEVKALEEKVEAARKVQPFNENFELLKHGKVETDVRKLTKEEIDPRSCPAVSSSVWPSPGRWLPSPACCSWTSRFPIWMPNCVWKCAMNCSGSMWRPAPPSYTSPTTKWRP